MKTVDELLEEVDIRVKKLVELFALILKYKILFKGTGLDFAGLKEYSPGEDDAKRIDWVASMRTQRLLVRQYEEERDLDVFILLDTSASMLFGTQKYLKSEYASILAGCLTFAALETGDNIGFATFSDKVNHFLEPSQDYGQYYQILKIMVDPRNWGGRCNLELALKFTLENLRERTALFIISDFIGIGEGWKDALKMVSAKFDRVIGIMVRDIRDTCLPKGIGYIRVRDPFTGRVKTVNADKIREKFERLAKQQEEEVEREFLSSRAGFVKIYTHQPFIQPLIKYLQMSEVVS